ncbi:polysaccharide pyruvyl transferase family protein [Microbacterium sp. KUDC0406]|uniref:polysaccharide pyruvyl transferase family protein n=1 Tax=Microbacterium sp. KUDC0406 TaxID=2909588 RepID=UPI001F200BC7|nr:polysaccharide pyruvyl transferase family protein [Microbacterium sp. KUDC0406]UJP08916.1 polysaccharide pyruvyl transferase family protein [Microbacterium sp. KUDC0406]
MTRVAVFSFADIDNYGDILFSHVVRRELLRRRDDLVVDFISPTSTRIGEDLYHHYDRDAIAARYDALILAGGEVVHFFDRRSWQPIYERLGVEVPSGRASDVVWDWSDLPARTKAWLSVGVRPFEDQTDPARVAATLDRLDFVSVRGILSRKILEGGEYVEMDDRIRVSPDLGWLFPRLLNDEAAPEQEAPYAVFQFHNITVEEGARIAEMLRTFRRMTGLNVILLPVIHLWNDRASMQPIVDAAAGEITMPAEKLEPLEITRIVAGATIVMSSSLHVAITALAYGIPAAIFNKWPGTKFQDLLGLQMRTEMFARSVDAIPSVLNRLMVERDDPSALRAYRDFMVATLDRTFDELAAVL